MGKHHATVINSYKKGKEFTELKYNDFIKICEEVKSITSYCEITMGMSHKKVDFIVDQMYNMLEQKLIESDISKTGVKIAIYNLIRKIKENIL